MPSNVSNKPNHTNMTIFQNDLTSEYPQNDYRSRKFKGDWRKHFINEFTEYLFSKDGINVYEKFADHKREHLPKSLYKFFPPSIYSLINVHNQIVYLSTPRNFNDPFDSYVCIDFNSYIKAHILKKLVQLKLISLDQNENSLSKKEYFEILNSWSKNDPFPFIQNESTLRDFYSTFYEIKSSKSNEFKELLLGLEIEASNDCHNKIDYLRNMEFRITSFSNFKDEIDLLQNTTMWSHYASNHYGFCVKYKIDFEKIESKHLFQCGLYPVKYTSKVQKVSPKELAKLQFKDNDLALNKVIYKTVLKALTTKSTFWNYEKEWRLIIRSDDFLALTNNALKFFPIEAIYLGCRIEANIKKHLIQFAELTGIKVYQTHPSQDTYKLGYYELDTKVLYEQEFIDQLKKINQIKSEEDRILKASILYDKYYSK